MGCTDDWTEQWHIFISVDKWIKKSIWQNDKEKQLANENRKAEKQLNNVDLFFHI